MVAQELQDGQPALLAERGCAQVLARVSGWGAPEVETWQKKETASTATRGVITFSITFLLLDSSTGWAWLARRRRSKFLFYAIT